MQKLSRDQAPWIKTLLTLGDFPTYSSRTCSSMPWLSVCPQCLVSCPHNASVSTAQECSSTWAGLQPAHSYIIGSLAFVLLRLRRSLVQSYLYPRRGFSCVDQGFFSAAEIISMHVSWHVTHNGAGGLGNFSYWLNPTLKRSLAEVLQTTWVCPCSSGPSAVQGQEHLLGQMGSSWHGQGAAHQGPGQAGFGSDSYLNKMLTLFSSLCE